MGLSDKGFDIVCESHPDRAIQLIQTLDIDAAVLDYDMPECNGLQLSKTIRHIKPSLPIVV